jgi:myo-inositol-1(or 4)-monophosphatase
MDGRRVKQGRKTILQTAIEAALRAGRTILERYPGERKLTVKGYRDLVTDADMAAEEVIIDLIRARFPDHAILSEEAGGDEISSDYTWVIDPLDGTANYTHHHPVFAVCIGVPQDGNPLMGVIHDPLRNHTFAAHRGGGARLNDVPIHVSRVANLGDAMVGLDWGHANGVRKTILAYLHQLALRCGTLRVLGSAALALAYVATGWLDTYFSVGLKPWDTAAGILMVSEAGGRCSTLKGEAYRVNLPGCLATNGIIHDPLLAVFHGADVIADKGHRVITA